MAATTNNKQWFPQGHTQKKSVHPIMIITNSKCPILEETFRK